MIVDTQYNIGKCILRKEQKWTPSVTLMGSEVGVVSQHKILGVVFDESMTFAAHIEALTKKVKMRFRALRALSGQSWGPSCSTVRCLHLAYIDSIATYGIVCWHGYAARSSLKELQIVMNEGCRQITGCKRAALDTLVHMSKTRYLCDSYTLAGVCLAERVLRLQNCLMKDIILDGTRFAFSYCSLRARSAREIFFCMFSQRLVAYEY